MRFSVLSTFLFLFSLATADPTWPNAIDELEELAFQLFSANARKFADNVSPCTDQPFGPGRVAAAEWVRTAFHDMATGSVFFGTGGADASIQFELSNPDSTGIGFKSTLTWMSPFMTRKTSMADLIGLGLYASIRSCGGPKLGITYGRVDATTEAFTGVPQVQNAYSIFKSQFARMGFNEVEMTALVACGHSLGGVHAANTPSAVPANTYPNNMAAFDTTPAVFDNAVVTEYLDNTTADPLVVGPYMRTSWRSDLTVFSRNNATMRSLADNTTFMNTCQDVLTRMYELVPTGVTLSSPIVPYVVKPYRIALALDNSATTLFLTGSIRIHSGTIPLSSITSVTIHYKSRSGSTGGSYTTSLQGYGRGFDDEFGYYPLRVSIDTAVGISSFTIDVNMNDGTKRSFDNNGNEYLVQDYVFLQNSQSCLNSGSGAFTAVAAVHNSQTDASVSAVITYKIPRSSSGTNPVPQMSNMTIEMAKGTCYGDYTFYTASTTIPGGISVEATIDIVSSSGDGTYTDEFRRGRDIGGSCMDFSGISCNANPGSSSSSSSLSSSSTSFFNSTVVPSGTGSLSVSVTSITSETLTSSSVPATSSFTVSSTAPSSTVASATPTESLHHRESIGGYTLVSCQTEGSGVRALDSTSMASDEMTLEMCMDFCSGYNYWGTEYGRECYCGNYLASSSTEADSSECNMVCAGDATQYCGAGNRLELYKTTASVPMPTGTLSHRPTVGAWSLIGCWTEGDNVRALGAAATSLINMTNEVCAEFCSGYKFFGTEYSKECYCGDELAGSSTEAEISECSMLCAGSPVEYCGGPSRLELYTLSPVITGVATSVPLSSASVLSSSILLESSNTLVSTFVSMTSLPSSSAHMTFATSSAVDSSTVSSPFSSMSTVSSSPTSATATLQNHPTISPDWTFVGCKTEGDNVRALSSKSTSSSNMTLDTCAAFCSEFTYFGTEYGAECYCGFSLAASSQNASLTDCSMTCSGDGTQYCGAGNRLTVYKSPVSAPVMPSKIGNFTLVGCQTEANGTRALSAKATSGSSMTNELCAEFCSGYSMFGTEYGAECYCGNEVGRGSAAVDEGECNMQCTGSYAEYCGAGNRLSLYRVGV
ncbi:hypothetical protein TD95_003109 [Thielaviopsis punctulata]|uniref:Peroxidase n=1 Tax=Thielaviopsis punctulata TaxID=72032 RepID=A0A0F4ZH70_9PEZI|nr:hypothetical protein TD95_003109 [Thielaviopsis punctulata]